MTTEYSLSFFIALFLAGSAGACFRYGADRLIHMIWPTAYPSGTMLVNITGAFFAGIVAGQTLIGNITEPGWIILSTGFAGSYTTFSGWMVQTVELFLSEYYRSALTNLVLTLIPGWLLTLSGFWLGVFLMA